MAIGSTITLIQKWPVSHEIHLTILDEYNEGEWWTYITDKGTIFTKGYKLTDFIITNEEISNETAIISKEIFGTQYGIPVFSDLYSGCYDKEYL